MLLGFSLFAHCKYIGSWITVLKLRFELGTYEARLKFNLCIVCPECFFSIWKDWILKRMIVEREDWVKINEIQSFWANIYFASRSFSNIICLLIIVISEKNWNFVSHYIIEYKSHVRDQKGNEFCSGSIYEEQFSLKIILIQCYYNKSLNIRIYLPPIITHLYLTINRNSSGNASNLEKTKKTQRNGNRKSHYDSKQIWIQKWKKFMEKTTNQPKKKRRKKRKKKRNM